MRKVNKIRSYQTLVYKNGINSHQKNKYKEYQKEIRYQLVGLPKINDLRDLEVSIQDYYGILSSFTEEEIRLKYGKLIIKK